MQPATIIEESFSSNCKSGWIMRRLAVFFLLLSFVVTSSNNSMDMFSIEQGTVYAESYNLNHILNSLPTTICNSIKKYNDSLTPTRNYNHSHVVLLNSLNQEESDIIISQINQIQTVFTFPIQGYLHFSIPAKTSLIHSTPQFLSPPKSSILQSTILLIW